MVVLVINEQQIPLLSQGAAARVAGVDRSIVHDAMASGKLPFRRIDGVRYVDQLELVAWAQSAGHAVARVAA
jgi:hypothetical protein